MRLIATRRATSLLKPRVSIDSQYTIRGELVMVCAYAKQDGRGNLRVAKTPPLQSGVCGEIVAGMTHRPSFTPTWYQRERRMARKGSIVYKRPLLRVKRF